MGKRHLGLFAAAGPDRRGNDRVGHGRAVVHPGDDEVRMVTRGGPGATLDLDVSDVLSGKIAF